jgi:hypothetical protein
MEKGLASAFVIRWPIWPSGPRRNEIERARISMMAGSSNARSMGRIQKRKTNLSKSSLSACNARPVHTDGPRGGVLRSGLQIRLRLSRSIPVYLRNFQPVGVSWLLQRSLSVSITRCPTLFGSNFGSNGPELFSYFGALQPERVALCHTCHDGVARPHCCCGRLARGSRPPPRFVQQSVPDSRQPPAPRNGSPKP